MSKSIHFLNIIFYNQENKSKQLRCLRRPPFFPGPKKGGKERPGSPILAFLFVLSPAEAAKTRGLEQLAAEIRAGESTHRQ